jgi:hypothetical protein
MRHPDGVWAGYTYEWNEAETAATRVTGGKTRQVGGQTWIYPSEGECMLCHTSAAGFSLGPEIAQLNGPLAYPDSGVTANQLATLEHIDLLSPALPGPPATLPALADPANAGAPLTDRPGCTPTAPSATGGRTTVQPGPARDHRAGRDVPPAMRFPGG